MNLSKRTRSKLDKKGIKNLADLSKLTEDEILTEFQVGVKGLREIIEALRKEGLSLSGEPVFSSRESVIVFSPTRTNPEDKITLNDKDRDNFIKKLLENKDQ